MAPSRKRKSRPASRAPGGRSNPPAPGGDPLPDDSQLGGLGRYGAWLVLATVVVLVVVVRIRLAAVPLERDEGEYAYAGQLILHGVPPYVLAYNMKFPGTYYAYSVILALFGQTPSGIHVGLLFVNLATVALLLALGRRWLGLTGAALAAACFAVLSLDRGVMGAFAHATHFVLLPALAGLLLLLRAIDTKRQSLFGWAGVLFGIATLMKQPGMVFLLLGLGYATWTTLGRTPGRRLRTTAARLGFIAAGAAAPLALLCIVLAAQGVLGKFWFWTFHYPQAYLGLVPADRIWPIFAAQWREVSRATFGIWAAGGAGLVAVWTTRWPTDARIFLSGLVLAGLVAISPGFYFRSHYWVLALPAVALLAGVAVVSAERAIGRLSGSPRVARLAVLAGTVAVLGGYVVAERAYCFTIGTQALSRATFGANPFPEAPAIAQYIRERTSPAERVAVLGSEPEIYFYADRKSATGYIYTYPLMEAQPDALRMQREMMQEIEAVRPAYLVLASMTTSWVNGALSAQPILSWSRAYSAQCYDLVGVADIGDGGTTVVWDRAATTYEPKSLNVMFTFRRKTPGACAVAQAP
jgi:hypothetical protein